MADWSRPMFHPDGRQEPETHVFEYWPIEKCAATAADRLFIKSCRPLDVLKPKINKRRRFYFWSFFSCNLQEASGRKCNHQSARKRMFQSEGRWMTSSSGIPFHASGTDVDSEECVQVRVGAWLLVGARLPQRRDPAGVARWTFFVGWTIAIESWRQQLAKLGFVLLHNVEAAGRRIAPDESLVIRPSCGSWNSSKDFHWVLIHLRCIRPE